MHLIITYFYNLYAVTKYVIIIRILFNFLNNICFFQVVNSNKVATEAENGVELRINEHQNGLDELSRLTAEFESFVKNSQHDIHHDEPRIAVITENDAVQQNENEKVKANGKVHLNSQIIAVDKEKEDVEGYAESQAQIEVVRSMAETQSFESNGKHIECKHESIEIEKVTTFDIVNEDLRIKEVELKIKEAAEENSKLFEHLRNSQEIDKIEHVQNHQHHYHHDKQSPPREVIQTLEVHQLKTEVRSFPEIQRLTPTPTPSSREETPDYIPLTVREKFHSLRIDESEDLPSKASENKNTNIVVENHKPAIIEERRVVEVKMPIKEHKLQIEEAKEETTSSPSHSHSHSPTLKDIGKVEEFKPSQKTTILQKETRIFTSSATPTSSTSTAAPVVRDTTPIPLARTEIEYKLNSQGFIRDEKPIKFNDFEKCIVRRKESDSDGVVLRNGNKRINNDRTSNEVEIEGDGEPPKVPQRRRSVKDIIESINRQQKKLKINQPPSPQLSRKYFYGEQKFSYHEKPAVASKENVLLKLQRQAESERKINELLDDLQDFSKINPNIRRTQKFPVATQDTNKSNKNNISIINPIPKPRRNI